jgi:hypothetical protein
VRPLILDTSGAEPILREMTSAETVTYTNIPAASTTERGAVELSDAAPPSITTTNTQGSSSDVAREDHTHAHGSQTDETLHAVATQALAGFESAADKVLVDDIPRLQVLAASVGQPDEDQDSLVETLWVIGSNRWRCGTSTSGYVGAYFYAEMPSSFGGTMPNAFASDSDIALYSPIGVPNTGSPNSNAPATTETILNASMYWDDGVPIPPNQFTNGAVLEIDLFGQLKIGRTGTLYVVIDPDGDVRLTYTGDNSTVLAEAHKVVGAESGVQTHENGVVSDDGGDCLITFVSAHGLTNGDLVWLSTGDRTVSDIMPDLVDGGYYYAAVVDAYSFKPSTTTPGAAPGFATATFVPWNPAGGETTNVCVTKSTGSGSWKQVKFAFDLASVTPNSDFAPCKLKITGCAEGRGHSNDTEDGVFWLTGEYPEMNGEEGMPPRAQSTPQPADPSAPTS